MYVNFKLAIETASQISGIRLWLTNEYMHSGLRDGGAKVFDHLTGMLNGKKPLFWGEFRSFFLFYSLFFVLLGSRHPFIFSVLYFWWPQVYVTVPFFQELNYLTKLSTNKVMLKLRRWFCFKLVLSWWFELLPLYEVQNNWTQHLLLSPFETGKERSFISFEIMKWVQISKCFFWKWWVWWKSSDKILTVIDAASCQFCRKDNSKMVG